MNDASEPPSPCIDVCTMDPRWRVCRGCYRTLDEIGGWRTFSPEQKRATWRRLRARKRAIEEKDGT